MFVSQIKLNINGYKEIIPPTENPNFNDNSMKQRFQGKRFNLTADTF